MQHIDIKHGQFQLLILAAWSTGFSDRVKRLLNDELVTVCLSNVDHQVHQPLRKQLLIWVEKTNNIGQFILKK